MKSDDEEQYSSKSSLISVVATVSKLKRKVLVERSSDVNDKMESNSAKLRKYTSCLSNSAEQWGHMSLKEDVKQTFRSQKVLCNFGNTDAGNDGRDDCSTVAPSIIFGTSSGGKAAPKPSKLFVQPNVPPYTTWIYLDRNQRMTEDQSVQGRRRIYYDPVGNETLIASDSEEEEPGDEVAKHDFSKGEDFIIWAAVQERGLSNLLFEQIAQCINVNVDEVQARSEILLKDADKQAISEAHVAGVRSLASSPSGRRKGSKDMVRSAFTETQGGPQLESHVTAIESGLTRKVAAEKATEAKDLVAAMDSFDNLFCRRCLVFDCRLHGCSQPLVHPSERQPSANLDAESVVPCGSHCYLSSQRDGVESSDTFVQGMRANAGGVSSGLEGAERVRAAKRQKTQDSAIWSASQKVGSPNSDREGTAKLVANSAHMRSKMDSSAGSVVNIEDKVRLDQSEPAAGTAINDDFESRKRDQAPLGARLTSHKKLARISRKQNVENGSFGGLHKCQTQLTVIDLTDTDGKLSEKDIPGVNTNHLEEMNRKSETVPAKAYHQTESNFIDLTSQDDQIAQMEGAGSGNIFVEGMNGKAIGQAHSPELPRTKHVSKKVFREDFAIVQQAGVRVSSTKKLARNGKRALQEYGTNLPSRNQIDPDQPDDNPRNCGQICSNGKYDTDRSKLKKPARTAEAGAEMELAGGVPAAAVASEGLEADICQKAVDLDNEKYKVASPKKLARSARKPVAPKVLGMVELMKPQPVENVKASGEDAGDLVKEEVMVDQDRILKGEKTRNTAAKKLARSARKAFAEKVAEAIQHQQFHSQVDVVNKLRGGREHVREEKFEASGIQQVKITADTVRVLGDQSQSKRSMPDKIFGVDNRQLVDKSRHILKSWKETADEEDDVKPDRALTRSGIAGGGAILKGEDDFKKFEFKHNWTVLEIGLFEKGLEIFGESSCAIAKNMLKECKTCAEVGDYMKAREAAAMSGAGAGIQQLSDNLTCVLKWNVARARARFYGKRKGSRKLKFTLKSAGQSAIRKRMVNGKDAPCRQYTPCGCLFTCGKQCPCQLSGTCCEKYCGCAKGCKNRFRGCHCAKSQCCSRQCPCFAAGRECDPDVCRNCWIGCGDGKSAGPSQREDKDHYQCHNMKLLLKQQQRVLLSRSDVAGWGAFLKNTVSKHEYLGEYTGELISHREADKRGKIYDRENSSFLFNLNDQYVLDACRKGDKLKFANHSPNPNCYAKVIMVAGDHRVGIFAKERILAGEELFYDYRYEADRAPAWARRGEDSGSSRKDDNGSGERRSKHAS